MWSRRTKRRTLHWRRSSVEAASVERARQWVHSTFGAHAHEVEEHGAVLRYELLIAEPPAHDAAAPGLGTALTALANARGGPQSPIVEYAITRTSLEQIYLAISTEADARAQQEHSS